MLIDMKNIYKSLFVAAALAMPFMTSCKDDNDDNPTLKTPTSFVLNQPDNAVNVYDLENSDYVVFTTSQPDYGYTAPVTYTAHVSLDGQKFERIGATSNSTTVSIPAKDMNTAILSLAGSMDLSAPIPVIVYLSAAIDALPKGTTVNSNTVTLDKVLAFVPKVSVSIPENIYIVGGFAGSNWDEFIPFHTGYSTSVGTFFAVVQMEEGKNFRFATKQGWGATFGWTDVTRKGEVAEALVAGDNDNNITFTGKTGLYNVMFKAEIANGAIAYTLTMEPAKLYLIGAAAGGVWDKSEDFRFVDNGDGTATATVAGDGEARMFIDCGTDWWKTEFTIKNSDGSLFYRNCDIPSDWATDLGDDFSFQVSAGDKVTLDFTSVPASGKK